MATPPNRPSLKIDDYPSDGLSTPDALQKLFSTLNSFGDSVVSALDKGLKFAENFNAEVKQVTIQTPTTAWVTVAPNFKNSWANSASYSTQYRIGTDGRIYVRGNVSSGTANTTIFTFPAALKPVQDANFVTESSGTYAKVYVEASTGNLKQAAGTQVGLSLDCVQFEPAVAAPYVMSCFPVKVACGLQSIAGVYLINVYDNTSNAQVPCALGSVHISKAAGGYNILNLPGLVINKRYTVTLVAVGG